MTTAALNPNGRPRGATNFATEPSAWCKRRVQGDPRALMTLLTLSRDHDPQPQAEAVAPLAANDRANAAVSRVRGWIEKVFGTCKRSYGLRRMRWIGLAKARLQVRLTAIAFNLRRSWRLLLPLPA
ncbi:MAG: transposase [Alphaproteobacteria bacterium]|nr:transposase [Alphaproteobacteria bacterium]